MVNCHLSKPRPLVLSNLDAINAGVEEESRGLSRTIHIELVSALLNARPVFLLFDKDGLLINSEFVRKVAWINAFECFGVDTGLGQSIESMQKFADDILLNGWDDAVEDNLSVPALGQLAYMGSLTQEKVDEFLLHHYGDSLRATDRYLDDTQAIALLREYREEALQTEVLSQLFSLRPGVKELLQKVESYRAILKEEFSCDIGCAVVTSDNRSDTEDNLKHFGVADYFQALVCAKEVARSKPAKDPYEEGAKRLAHVFNTTKKPYCLGFEDAPLGVAAFVDAGMRGYFIKDLVGADIARTEAVKAISLHSAADALEEAVRVAREVKELSARG